MTKYLTELKNIIYGAAIVNRCLFEDIINTNDQNKQRAKIGAAIAGGALGAYALSDRGQTMIKGALNSMANGVKGVVNNAQQNQQNQQNQNLGTLKSNNPNNNGNTQQNTGTSTGQPVHTQDNNRMTVAEAKIKYKDDPKMMAILKDRRDDEYISLNKDGSPTDDALAAKALVDAAQDSGTHGSTRNVFDTMQHSDNGVFRTLGSTGKAFMNFKDWLTS